jgi:hypothetical protein
MYHNVVQRDKVGYGGLKRTKSTQFKVLIRHCMDNILDIENHLWVIGSLCGKSNALQR